MKNLYVYGTGYLDFIKLIDAINRKKPEYKISGFINDSNEFRGKVIRGIKVLGGKEIIPNLIEKENAYFFHNINKNPKTRQNISKIFEKNNCRIVSLIHPDTDLNYVKYKKGCYIPEGCILGSNVIIGNYLTCRLGAIISHDVTIEDYVYISPNATCGGNSYLKKGCFIGAGATIMFNRTIGENSIIGAGSVVTKDIPDNVVACGCPAKEIRKINKDERRD